MKRPLTVLLIAGMVLAGCASPGRYNTQKGAAIGAGLGALMGQAIGRSTEATLIGAGAGTLIGSVLGNAEDQRAEEQREQYAAYQAENRYPEQESAWAAPEAPAEPSAPTVYQAPEPQVRTQPPGKWIRVPGHWEGNVWVPEHQEWHPTQPY